MYTARVETSPGALDIHSRIHCTGVHDGPMLETPQSIQFARNACTGSIDDGAHWTQWRANLPIIPVHDLKIHPRENDIVLATYGRAIWEGDMHPLRELSAETLARPAYLFDVEPSVQYNFGTQGMNYALYGNKNLRVPNAPEGALTRGRYTVTLEAAGERLVKPAVVRERIQ